MPFSSASPGEELQVWLEGEWGHKFALAFKEEGRCTLGSSAGMLCGDIEGHSGAGPICTFPTSVFTTCTCPCGYAPVFLATSQGSICLFLFSLKGVQDLGGTQKRHVCGLGG